MKILKLTLLLVITIIAAGCKKLSDLDPIPATVIKAPITPTIVILGSSTAQGIGASCIDSSWAKKLLVFANKKTKANFINLAYGGYTTYHVLPTGCVTKGKPVPDSSRNITRALLYKPTLVLISLPTNDVAANYSNQEIVGNFVKLTHLLDSAKVQYIIFGTQPRDFSSSNERMQLKSLDDTLRSVYTYHMNDFLTALSTSTYCIKPALEYGDGIHVDNAGHTIIFNSISQHPLLTNQLQ